MHAVLISIYVVLLIAQASAVPVDVHDSSTHLAAVATAMDQSVDSLLAVAETAEESHGFLQTISQNLASINTMLHQYMHKFMMKIHCPEGGFHMGTQCFFIPKGGIKRKSWEEAQSVCKEQGGILPEPRGKPGENNDFHMALNSSWGKHSDLYEAIYDPDEFYSGIWLGASDREQEGVWKWSSDGARLEVDKKIEPVPEWASFHDNSSDIDRWGFPGGLNWWNHYDLHWSERVRYGDRTNWWYAGEPNNYNGNENCLFMMAPVDYPFDDRNCENAYSFICEMI